MPRIEPTKSIEALAPARGAGLQQIRVLRGPVPLPKSAVEGVDAFEAAAAAFDGDPLAAARGFLKAAALFVADKPARYAAALDEQAAAAYENAATCFRAAGAVDDGERALADAAKRDPAHAALLATLASSLQ